MGASKPNGRGSAVGFRAWPIFGRFLKFEVGRRPWKEFSGKGGRRDLRLGSGLPEAGLTPGRGEPNQVRVGHLSPGASQPAAGIQQAVAFATHAPLSTLHLFIPHGMQSLVMT